jgi:release factor glutamine methyltransferase
MRGIELKSFFIQNLEKQYGSRESENIFFILVDHHLNQGRLDWNLEKETPADEGFEAKVHEAIKELETGKPIQHIIGYSWFYNLQFKINGHALIPRPETEELVDLIVKNEKDMHAEIDILDIGTGSGCIALSVAHSLEKAKLVGWDISEEALNLARENAALLGIANIEFWHEDILDLSKEGELQKWDVIVSNPPYIMTTEGTLLESNVRDFEPATALFVTDGNPLQFYKRILAYAQESLKLGGRLYFECHENYAKQVERLMEAFSYTEILVKEDLQGKPRMVFGTRSM